MRSKATPQDPRNVDSSAARGSSRPAARAPGRLWCGPLFLLLVGCEQTPVADQESSVARELLVTDRPTELLAFDGLRKRLVVESLRLAGRERPESVRFEGATPTPLGICLAPGYRQATIHTGFGPELQGATNLEAEITDLAAHSVEMSWIDGETGAVRHRERQFWSAGAGSRHERFSFALAPVAGARPGDRIALLVTGSETRRPCLAEIRWVRESPDDALTSSARSRSWRLDIDHEVRDAQFIDLADGAAATLPADAAQRELLATFAIWGPASTPWVFDLELVEGDHPLLLATATIAPEQSGHWQELRAKVPAPRARADRKVRLRARALSQVGGGASGTAVVSSFRLLSDRRALPNILLVSIDTLRADRMSLYGANRPTTPRLDAWAARRAVTFEKAIAAAPWTLPSHTSLFSGLDAHRHGVVYSEPVPLGIPLLAEMLRESGYLTAAITGAGYLDPRYGLHRGFDRYRYWGRAPGGPNEIRDGADRAIAFLKEARDFPFFLFFHTYEVHPPLRAREPWFSHWSRLPGDRYVVPESAEGPAGRDGNFRFALHPPRDPELREPLPTELSALPYDLYDSGVASADDHVGRILDQLAASGLEDGTIVVVTSDHGESLGEHGLAGHGFLYDDNLWVPLVVALPSAAGAGSRVAAQVRLVDVMPTLLEAAGQMLPAELDGRALQPLLAGATEVPARDALAYSGSIGLAIRKSGRAKYLFWDGIAPDRADRDRYFQLERDPGELVDELPGIGDRAPLELEGLRTLADSPGLRISFRGGRPTATRVSGGAIAPDRVKWLSRPGAEVRLRGEHGLEVAPGSAGDPLLLVRSIGAPRGQLRFETAATSGAPARVDLDLERLDLRSERVLRVLDTDGALVIEADLEGPRPTNWVAEVWWRGGDERAEVDPASRDRSLREQLGALGYLQ